MNCPFCKKEVDASVPVHVRYEVLGYERSRSAGGTNAIELRQRTGVIAHAVCVDKAKRGLTGQQTLS